MHPNQIRAMESYNNNPKVCKQCDAVILYSDRHKKSFCNRSCSATFNNLKREKKVRKYNCLHCGTEHVCTPSKSNIYCSNKCQREYQYHNVTKLAIEAGTCSNVPSLKRFLIESFGEQCVDCGVGSVWNNKPLTLQLDHVDGDSDNNHPSNLRLLCPNCHTQTPTYGSKGLGNRYKKQTKRNAYIRAYHQIKAD